MLIYVTRFAVQLVKIYLFRKNCTQVRIDSTEVFLTEKDTAPFSFFSKIFISKSMGNEFEIRTIVSHEKVHIQERHWADLLILELTRFVQWFNPIMILYRKAMMQNHEYLADRGVTVSGINVLTYQAILANQLLGIPVVRYASSFTMFNPTKRILMMNKNKTRPTKQLKLLWVIPVMALIMYAFAEPKYTYPDSAPIQKNKAGSIKVTGKVLDEEGAPLPGASVVIANSTVGGISDKNGEFILDGVKPEDKLVFSFVGYETRILKVKEKITVKMERKVYKIVSPQTTTEEVAPPPPPPPPPFKIENTFNGKKPLVVVDGKIYNGDINEIDPETIEFVEVIKDETATTLYGDKGKDGVIKIKTQKKDSKNAPDEVFVIVEDMPEFIGGEAALNDYIGKATASSGEKGSADVSFTVMADGKIDDIKVLKSSSEKIKEQAIKIIQSMPAWKPGKQRGKPVKVNYQIQINF